MSTQLPVPSWSSPLVKQSSLVKQSPIEPRSLAPQVSPPSPRSRLLIHRASVGAGVAIAAIAGANLIPVSDRPEYEGRFQLVLSPSIKEAAPRADRATPAAVSTPTIDAATTVEVLWSPKVLSPVVQQLQAQYPDLDYSKLRRNLDITPQSLPNTLEVRYHDTDPQKVQAVVDRVAQAFLTYGQECRTSTCREQAFVEKQLPTLQRQVLTAEKKLQSFQQQHGLTDSKVLGQQLADRSNALAQQQQQLSIRLTEARSLSTVLHQQLALAPSRRLAETLLSQNQRYSLLLNHYQGLANQLAIELARPQAQSNTIQSLQQQYQQVAQQLDQTAQQSILEQLRAEKKPDAARQATLRGWIAAANQLQVLEVSRGAIAQAKSQLDQHIKQWATLDRQNADLQRDVQFAKEALNQYLTRRDSLQSAPAPQSWRMIAPPEVIQVETRQPIVTDTQRDVGLGLLLSFILVVWALTTLRAAQSQSPSVRLQQVEPSPALPESHDRLPVLPAPRSLPVWMAQAHQPEVGRVVMFLLMVVTRAEVEAQHSSRTLQPREKVLTYR